MHFHVKLDIEQLAGAGFAKKCGKKHFLKIAHFLNSATAEQCNTVSFGMQIKLFESVTKFVISLYSILMELHVSHAQRTCGGKIACRLALSTGMGFY